MRHGHRLACAVVVEQVDRAPVGDLGHRQPSDVAQRLLVVERGGQHLAGPRQELHAQGRALAAVTSSMMVTAASIEPARVTHRGRLQQHPLLLAGDPVDRAQQQRLGLLAAQQPDGGEVLHADRMAVLTGSLIRPHQRSRIRVAQILHRGKSQSIQRSLVGVDEVIVGAADRNRLGQRVDDHRQALLGAPESALKLVQQASPFELGIAAFGDVGDERVKGPSVVLGQRRDRHLDGKLASVGAQCAEFHALIEQRALAGLLKAAQSLPVGVAIALGDDRVGQHPSNGIGAREAEHLLGARVPVRDPTLFIHRDERIVGDIENRLCLSQIHGGGLSPKSERSGVSAKSAALPIQRYRLSAQRRHRGWRSMLL